MGHMQLWGGGGGEGAVGTKGGLGRRAGVEWGGTGTAGLGGWRRVGGGGGVALRWGGWRPVEGGEGAPGGGFRRGGAWRKGCGVGGV